MTSSILLEVAIASADDARTAADAGADRLELNTALELDGLTPTPAVLAATLRVGLPVVVMLRSRPGGFCYTDRELDIMRDELEWIGGEVALGILTNTSSIDVPRLKRFPTSRVVFHRAFDLVPDPFMALEQLIDLGIPRVMISAADHDRIAHLIDAARERIDILPAGGVRPENVRQLVQRTGCTSVHGSFKRLVGNRLSPFAAHHETCGPTVRLVRSILDER